MHAPWTDARREFAALRSWTYLNTATYGLVPARSVAASVAHFAQRDELACTDFLDWYDDADRIRASIARLIHAAPDDIAFIPNAASSLGLMASGIDWRPGDNAVTLADEFPNCGYLPAIVGRHGVEVREVSWDALESAIDDRTRLVALSEINYATGFRPPLANLSVMLNERDVRLYVDGTQSLGGVAWDVRDVQPDLLAVHGYKWMISPTGVGFMYVSPALRARLAPQVAGWRSDANWRDVAHLHHGTPTFKSSAERYEGGGLAFGLLHALGASVDWMLELGPEAIEARVLGLARSARERLHRLGATGGETNSPVVAVKFPGRDPSVLARRLKDRRVVVAARKGCLRVSPHFYNDESDLDRLEAEVAAILADEAQTPLPEGGPSGPPSRRA